MDNIEYVNNLSALNSIVKISELISIIICTFYTYVKISNIEKLKIRDKIVIIVSSIIIAILIYYVEKITNVYYGWFILIILVFLINKTIFKENIFYSTLATIISLSISYVLYVISIILAFFPGIILKSSNNYLNLMIILSIYYVIVNNIYKIKKLKYGMTFLKNKIENTFSNILIMNIATITLFSYILLRGYGDIGLGKFGFGCVVLSIDMFITIKQSFDLYYKQNLLTKDLEQTKAELEERKQEIDKLERENLEFSKSSHSLAHKQKSLEYKLEKLMKTGVDEKSKEAIKQEIQNISKEVYKEPQQIELPKTEIEAIDDMFSYMQSECIKDNIKFELQIVGNPFYMINHLISESELEILLADHIKDAIIAINYSDNTNRSILVRIGKIDNVYSLYIYDSGIEFEKEVLENLGKKPITTHADSGGTGMGFMNTFDTLNRTKASLIINEIGKPCIDNYTKVLIFKFDNKNEFIVNSYKSEVAVV